MIFFEKTEFFPVLISTKPWSNLKTNRFWTRSTIQGTTVKKACDSVGNIIRIQLKHFKYVFSHSY